MLKLKLQYFGHLMWRPDSLEETLMLGRLKTGGEGDDRKWDGWMASPPSWPASVHGVAKSRTWLKRLSSSSSSSHWKDWWWSSSSNTLVTWCEELTHWKRPWCWETLKEGGQGGCRRWDGCMLSLTQWTWIWTNSEIVKDREAWRTAVHGVTKSWTQLSNWTELNWSDLALTADNPERKGLSLSWEFEQMS